MRLDWATPVALYHELDAEFGFHLDVCANADNTKCSRYLEGDAGLTTSWAPGPAFMNPPYGREIQKWIARAHEQAKCGITVVALLPSRTDTRWWHGHVMEADEIRFIKGRLHFNERGPAPFPSCVVIWRGTS